MGGKGIAPPPASKGTGKGKGFPLPLASLASSKFEAGPKPPEQYERKPMPWTTMPAARFDNSIFAKLRAPSMSKKECGNVSSPSDPEHKEVSPNFDRFAKLFFKEKTQIQSADSRKIVKSKATEKKSVLDSNKTRNIEVFFSL